jgi:hypothetical protein
VVYLDSGSANRKDYTEIKGVLDKAFNGFVAKADRPIKKKKKIRGCFTLFHRTEFCCHKHAEPDSGLEAWYAILHMRDIIKTEQDLLVPERLQKASIDMANSTNAQVRAEFRAIQRTICSIILRDVTKKGGLFHAGFTPPPNAEIETRLELCYDTRTFNTLDGIHPFPPKPKT